MRDDLTALGVATTEELDAYWPGGAENQLSGRGAWYYCWGQYSSFARRGEHDTTDESAVAVEQVALQAFRDEPQAVELVRPLPDGSPFLACYPKSMATLALLDSIEEELRWLLERIEWLQKRWEQAAPEKTGEAIQLVTQMELYAAWICTTEGPGAPFNPAATWPDVPLDLQGLEVLDILKIAAAHHAVNRKRIELIAASLRKREGSDRKASWATLTMRAADALKTPMDHLTKTRSFASWFGQVALMWDDQAEQADRVRGRQAKPVPVEMEAI